MNELTKVIHELKILPEWYESLKSGIKSFEVRKDDRNPKFAPGDTLILREFDGKKYTGRKITADVFLVLRGEYCKEGYCIMSVKVKSIYPATPTTNYERLKNMSIDEMTNFIETQNNYPLKYCYYCECFTSEYPDFCDSIDQKNDCTKAVKNWLESEALDNA